MASFVVNEDMDWRAREWIRLMNPVVSSKQAVGRDGAFGQGIRCRGGVARTP